MDWEFLYKSMEERWRPEDVAKVSLLLLPELAPVIGRIYSPWYETSMWERHGRPGFKSHTVNTSIVDRFPGLPSDPASAVNLLTFPADPRIT